MKVLQVGPNSIHFHQFINELEKLDYSISIVTNEYHEQIGSLNYVTLNFTTLNPIKLFKNYILLKSYVKKTKPTLIHLHQINRLAFFTAKIAKKLNIPYLATAWGSDVLLMPQKNRLNKYIVKKVIKDAQIVTADSASMIEAMQKISFDDDKYRLIQYGIDVIKPIEKEKIIFSNRMFEPLYNIDKIIDYFYHFQKNNPDWKLIIAGIGTEEQKLKKMVSDFELNDKISFVGWLSKEQNNDWYAKSSIYISIPSSDGTSVSVLEAMSAECIPVLSDLKVTHEWVKDFINGIIERENENPLEKALQISKKELIDYNKTLVTQNASRENCIKKFTNYYEESLKLFKKSFTE